MFLNEVIDVSAGFNKVQVAPDIVLSSTHDAQERKYKKNKNQLRHKLI